MHTSTRCCLERHARARQRVLRCWARPHSTPLQQHFAVLACPRLTQHSGSAGQLITDSRGALTLQMQSLSDRLQLLCISSMANPRHACKPSLGYVQCAPCCQVSPRKDMGRTPLVELRALTIVKRDTTAAPSARRADPAGTVAFELHAFAVTNLK